MAAPMTEKINLSFYFVLILIALVGIAVFHMFLPFLVTLLVAFIFWQLFNPTFKYFEKKTSHKHLSSLLVCIIVFIVIVLPFFAIGSIATQEAIGVYKNVARDAHGINDFQENIKNSVYGVAESLSIPKGEIDETFASINLSEAAKRTVSIVTDLLQQGYQQVSHFIFLAFLMLFALYYLFLDGDKFIKYIFRLSPLSGKDEALIWERLLSMNRATIKGTFIIGVVQGFMGGIAFWILGVGSPAFWGVIMGIFSVLPVVGPVAVWVPVALWLLFTGAWVKAIILFLIGSFVIGSVDNFLRPKLIGNDTQLHPIFILIGTFGGIIEFGIMGFIIGPLLITIFVALLEIFEKQYIKTISK